jgi:hypothetical protein
VDSTTFYRKVKKSREIETNHGFLAAGGPSAAVYNAPESKIYYPAAPE